MIHEQRAIILANGEPGDPDLLRSRLVGWDDAITIAADAGSRHAATLGLRLDVVIGDLDSLDDAARMRLETMGTSIVKYSPHKDESDLELALLYAAGQGADHIVVVGAMGGRLDMALANVLLLTHPDLEAVRIEMWEGNQTAWIIHPPGDDITEEPGDTLSLIPLGGDATGVTTRNLEYPLSDETLIFGPARGVSNVMTAPAARVDLREGMLLAVHTPGRA